MHLKNLKQYYFIDKFDYSHLINLDKNISLIWRNKNKETPIKTLIELRNFCNKNNRKLYLKQKKAQAVGKQSYSSPLSFNGNPTNDVKNAKKRMRSAGTVAPPKKGFV